MAGYLILIKPGRRTKVEEQKKSFLPDDGEMKQLKESIANYGILNPLIVRPLKEGVYEIISGHRRRFAAEQLGYRKVPVIIRVMRDEKSVIAMVDANLQREQISYSEKGFAYKMRQGDSLEILISDFQTRK